MRGRGLARWIVPAVMTGLSVVMVYGDWLWRADFLVYDVFTRSRERPAPADVVLVAIDERSLAEIGRWPWPREVHADLIDRLARHGARAVALDIAFSEPGPGDDRLATAIRTAGRVALPVLHEQATLDGMPVESLPVPAIGTVAAALGHVDVEIDPDGIARTVYLEAGLGRPAWPHLALALARLGAGGAIVDAPGETDPDPGAPSPFEWVRNRRVLVPFAGPPGHFRHLSFVDVLHGTVPDGWLRDALVLVGPTATGLGDHVPTPVSGLDRPMSGIEFNANVLEALRRRATVEYLSSGLTAALTAALVLAGTIGLVIVRRQAAFVLLGLAVVVGTSWALLSGLDRWFTPTPAALGILLAHPFAARRVRQSSVARERARADVALGSLAEGVITAGPDGRVDYLNPVAAAWVGDGALGRDLAALLHVEGEAGGSMARASFDGRPVEATLAITGGAGLAVRASIVAIGGQQGAEHGLVVALVPREAAARPAVPADGAPRAGAVAPFVPVEREPARERLEARLTGMLAEARRRDRHVAVLVLDIAQLRHVNVAFGRRGGDALLQAVADRLRGAIREPEAVAHVGGDEFAILLDDLARPEDAEGLAARLIKVLDAPFSIDGVEVRARACVGVGVAGAGVAGAGAEDAESLLQRAETAKSWARDHGQGPVQLYERHMDAPALDRIVLERALQAALEQDQLELVYQPQVAIATGAVVGAEALVRWRHPQHGPIPTAAFIALAEEARLIEALGDWVLRAACRQLADWRDRGLPPLRVAVNVSPRQFLAPGLAGSIEGALRDSALDPAQLELEITETVLVNDVGTTGAALARIKAMGVGLALDDFGVGYSSLGHLARLPVDCVKIDRSFVDNVVVDGHDRTICLAVLAMARSMRRRVIAEGVETPDQLRFFASKGCDLVQGFYISRPLPAAEFERLLRDRVTFRTS